MKLFRRKKKKSKSVVDESEYTYTEHVPGQDGDFRVQTTPLRQLKTPRERMELAASTKHEMERLSDGGKSKITELQAPKTGNWMTRTRFFQDMCDSVFTLMDTDGSGEVDEKELYSGLLLVHLKLGTYAGPAACRPITREQCHIIFQKFDKDKGGSLDRYEFGKVMGVLFGNVLVRVVLQYSLTLMIVPFLANSVVEGVVSLAAWIWNFISTLDEHSSLANQIELTVEMARDGICELYRYVTPGFFQWIGDMFGSLLSKVPEKVWLSLPLTLTSAIMGLLIVPRSIMKMDDFFRWLADRNSADMEVPKPKPKLRQF